MSRYPIMLVMLTTGWLLSGVAFAQEQGSQTANRFWTVKAEELEYRYSGDDQELAAWNTDVYYGTDELKLRWLSKGGYSLDEDTFEQLQNQLVLQTPISDFFDAKAGVRVDTPAGPDRTYGVIGIAGLAPYWFEIDANLYVSDQGSASTELDAKYELLVTNRLILTLGLDAIIAFSEDREIGVGQGLASTELGARLSYDVIDRAFSPYIGVVYESKYGDTRDFAKADNVSTEDWFAVIGAKLSF